MKERLSNTHFALIAEWHWTQNGNLTPNDVTSGSGKKVWWKCPKGPDHEWKATIASRASGSGCPFCRALRASVTNSLAILFPEIADQWHPTKNKFLAPKNVVAGSSLKVWWKCPKGPDHEWQAAIKVRIRGNGCPFCAGKKVSVTNSLSSCFPLIAAEWHPTKNGGLTPSQIVSGTKLKVWWRCFLDPTHEWQAQISNRTRLGSKCPCCVNRKLVRSNSLSYCYPELADQWHPKKNGNLVPDQVKVGSKHRVWWKCSAGIDHEWAATVRERTTAPFPTGCPFCSNQKVSITNSLGLSFPDLAAEWHPAKNGKLTPDNVVFGSTKKIWWKCSINSSHEWQAKINSRTKKERATGCPFCTRQKVSTEASLTVHFPEIALEWHPTKNGNLTPDEIVFGSGKMVWWKCPKGPDHEWRTRVVKRTGLERGCPYCAGRQASITNSLAALFPDVAAEWHPVKNGDLTPSNITAGAQKKPWWQCLKDPTHEWQASVLNRTKNKTGCPLCTIAPRSKIEIMLAFELNSFVPFDIDQHKLQINGYILDVDIIIPSLKLVIEFDGSYWHRDKIQTDREKTARLNQAGWRVIRVRQEPLKPIGTYDVQLPQQAGAKECADMVLIKIQEVCKIEVKGIARYLSQKSLTNDKAALDYINKILKDRSLQK